MDKLADNMDALSKNVDKLWKERWLYRVLPLTLLGFIGVSIWQIIANWDSISQFFNAMNTFFQSSTH